VTISVDDSSRRASFAVQSWLLFVTGRRCQTSRRRARRVPEPNATHVQVVNLQELKNLQPVRLAGG
jgi:hypothetical protein